jgi:hypothetical protein
MRSFLSSLLLMLFTAGCATQTINVSGTWPQYNSSIYDVNLISVELRRSIGAVHVGSVEPEELFSAWHDTFETAIRDSRIFSGKEGSDVRLIIRPLKVDVSGVLPTKAVIVAEYSIVAVKSGKVLRSVQCESTGEASDFKGVDRYRKAFQAAVGKNIALVFEKLASK